MNDSVFGIQGSQKAVANDEAITPPKTTISSIVLDHDGLMTPVLQGTFGALEAAGTRHKNEGPILVRQSRLIQKRSGKLILSATLRIDTKAMPVGLVEKLRTSSIPFGQLLIDHGILAYASDRVIFRSPEAKDAVVRLGRQLNLKCRNSHHILCSVTELLVSETTLQDLASTQ